MTTRTYQSKDYNWTFSPETGLFVRWGNKLDEDPSFSPIGPEILDIEISTVCHGGCAWCYKSNTPAGINMSLATFKTILPKIPTNLTQIAFGIGDIDANKDLFKILQSTRDRGIVPNITINGFRMSQDFYNRLASLCGAVAVSHYNDDACFNAVKELTDRGLEQVNIHKLLSEETLPSCFELIDKVATDSRLEKLNAVVFLSLKQKGTRNRLHSVNHLISYYRLVNYAHMNSVQIGFDSCSGPNFLAACHNLEWVKPEFVEPCESGLFSLYINVKGEAFPCSFMEGEPGWEKGIDILRAKDFLQDVWFSDRLKTWRRTLLSSTEQCKSTCSLQKGCRQCPQFPITLCKINQTNR